MNRYCSSIPQIFLLTCILTLSNCSSSVHFSPTELPQAIVNTPYSACIYVTNARIADLKDIQISTLPKDEDIHIISLQERNIRLGGYNEDLNRSLQIESYPLNSKIASKNRNKNYNEIWLYGIPKHTGTITILLSGTTSKSHMHFKQSYMLTILANNNP